MTKKILGGILAVCALTLCAALLLFLGFLYNHFTDQIIAELEKELVFAKNGVLLKGGEYLSELPSGFARITWIDQDGTVLYDSAVDESLMENHAQREEVLQAQTQRFGKSIRHSATLMQTNIYVATKLQDQTVLRVSSTQQSIWALMLGMLPPLGIVLALAAGLSVLLAVRVSRRIVEPINQIDLEHPNVQDSYRELAPLLNRILTQNAFIARQMEQMHQKQDEFALITENMHEGFLLLDRTGLVISHNVSALRLLGVDSAVRLNLLQSDTFLAPALRDALDGKRHEDTIDLDGASYLIVASPVYDGQSITGAVVFMLDMTEKQQRETLRREFTSNVSHELKTPLTTIYGISELMVNGIVKPQDVPAFAKNIHDETGRLITLINDIIKLSQLDENSVPMSREPVDLYQVAQSVMDRLSTAAQSRQVTMTLRGSHAVVEGIDSILEEMIYNLCDNAIKYNHENGHVTVTISAPQGHARIEVQDTGIGIAREHLDRVFERFYRVDKSHSRKIGGTGLGLSIVKHGASFHGAKVHIDSTEGVGTTVSIQF